MTRYGNGYVILFPGLGQKQFYIKQLTVDLHKVQFLEPILACHQYKTMLSSFERIIVYN